MKDQEIITYKRVAEALNYLQNNFQRQPTLDEIADTVHLSPYHFQRIFTEWAGVSPKKFLQYISIGHAKKILSQPASTLSEASLETGLSGTGRLHDLFVNIEGMTPGEYKNGGENLGIDYQFFTTPFGRALVAATAKGICHLSFVEDDDHALQHLHSQFHKATFTKQPSPHHHEAMKIFHQDWHQMDTIKLHLKGSDFQLKVWECLLKIPQGNLSTYGHVAQHIHQPKAARAVGTAIGSNPVAFLIPCHRVIQASGVIGGYMWGTLRKKAIIGWEAAAADRKG
ncbi:methylated-DNA--[protein]-cysteine S-methyltransferase [Echinicola vietnamensis]|uniref:methylated-DNA--[protein]-cysteine S-methyltransferase n=1 Tax=Echinicola vietnamensis (strain DSM 17526 / LMG 23754 / KMM 6221) TaxID=926556 RepID=L0G247_ECHVK|nr:methylated-DNA--[protein]-cysteine S-methyltransferase [Echinicola vietnamensis]AGA79597.1 O-6-methylguanine DNA methyltransferase [Echinicola vietnamensis DSM 17526]